MMRQSGLTAASAALALAAAAAGPPAAAQTVGPVERSFAGELTPGDRTASDDSYLDCHRLSIAAGDVATIVLTAEAFAPYLAIAPQSDCAAMGLLWHGVDSDHGRGVKVVRFRAQQGEYGLVVNSERPGETGPYTVHVRIEAAAAGENPADFSRPAPEIFMTNLLAAGSPDPCSEADLRRWVTDDLATSWHTLADRGGFSGGGNPDIGITGRGDQLISEMSPDGRSAKVAEGAEVFGLEHLRVFVLMNTERGWRLDDVETYSSLGESHLRGKIAAASNRNAARYPTSGQCLGG